SGGQQQRLCIARAIAVEPDVVLMDEPASALDPIATQKIEQLLHELKSEYSFVIVTHNMQQAARVADMTAFFSISRGEEGERWGELIEYDETEKIFTAPSDKRTEDYVTGRFGYVARQAGGLARLGTDLRAVASVVPPALRAVACFPCSGRN